MNNDSKTISRRRFGRFAQGYVTSPIHAKAQELDRLLEIARPQPDWLGLDIATGGGHTALKFAPLMAHIIAADISLAMLHAAREFIAGRGIASITFQATDAENLPFADNCFDLVTCRIAPHHFPDCSGFVREAARVLKRGGLLLVQDHVSPEEDEAASNYIDTFEMLRDPGHHRTYSETEWVQMFRAAGLKVEYTEQFMKSHDFVTWANIQACAPEVVDRLEEMMEKAPDPVVKWMQPRDFRTPRATFFNHHIIIAGRKI